MTIRKTLSFTDFFNETYLHGVQTNNLSKYIEKLAIMGFESSLGTEDGLKIRLMQLKKEHEQVVEELNELKRKYAKYHIDKLEAKEKEKQEKDELERKKAFVRSVIKSGVLYDQDN